MTLLTIRARKTRKSAKALHASAQAEADKLLSGALSDARPDGPVLVVYGDDDASIYFEGSARPQAGQRTP